MLSSATNALRALEYLVDKREAGVSEIGRALGVTPGTAHRLVGTLMAEGFAEQNGANRKYRPGPKVLDLAERVRGRIDVREIAHDRLVELVERVRETANLGALQDNRIVYLDKVMSDQPFGIEAKIGSRVPAYVTALGKSILAHSGDMIVDRYITAMEAGEVGDGAHDPPTAKAFRSELAKVARQGFSEDTGDYMPDVFCVAAPVWGASAQPIAAVSVSVPRSRFRASRNDLVREVREMAEGLSRELNSLGITNPIN
jgi:DNA-binding IclR family transcriptional regulator